MSLTPFRGARFFFPPLRDESANGSNPALPSSFSSLREPTRDGAVQGSARRTVHPVSSVPKEAFGVWNVVGSVDREGEELVSVRIVESRGSPLRSSPRVLGGEDANVGAGEGVDDRRLHSIHRIEGFECEVTSLSK